MGMRTAGFTPSRTMSIIGIDGFLEYLNIFEKFIQLVATLSSTTLLPPSKLPHNTLVLTSE
jgi:hypothetical protein